MRVKLIDLLRFLLRDEDGTPRWLENGTEGPYPVSCQWCPMSPDTRHYRAGTPAEDIEHAEGCMVPYAESILKRTSR